MFLSLYSKSPCVRISISDSVGRIISEEFGVEEGSEGVWPEEGVSGSRVKFSDMSELWT